jgi:DNA-binding MarR family transcriptional regulator
MLSMSNSDALQQSVIEIGQAFAALTRGPRVLRAFESVRARAGVDLDRQAFLAIDTLDTQGPLRMTELAEACGVDIYTVSRLVARLQRAGLVTARQFDGDRRVVLLAATDSGSAQARQLKQARRDALASFLCEWTPDEREIFARLLARFVANLDTAEESAAVSRSIGE